jgi:uncharacterized protein (TIGR00661 family)
MKILYGIQQTGNGHITRSVKMINALRFRGITVDVIVSGHNSQIDLPFPIKDSFKGLTLKYTKTGNVSWLNTCLKSNIPKLIANSFYDISEYDLVISDFEPISAWSAKLSNKPCIGLGNQYSIQYEKIPKQENDGVSDFFLKNFAPCDLPIGIHYEEFDNSIFQPIISDEIIDKKIKDKNFYLVYLPNVKDEIIINIISKFRDHKFKIYTKIVNENLKLNNVIFKKIDRESFSKDLLNCSGIITASGFSTTSEALYLGKKLWSIPIKKHYEQLSNSMALKQIGVYTEDFSKDNLKEWLLIDNEVKYVWKDPTEKIIQKIIDFYEKGKN